MPGPDCTSLLWSGPDVEVEEEMYKKDGFSPATSERDVDVQDKVDEVDVAKDDCPREPKTWGLRNKCGLDGKGISQTRSTAIASVREK